jgi:MFS family permease
MGTPLFFPGWKVVAGSGIGIGFGSAVFFAAGFALLSGAIGRQFGWTQPQLAGAATLYLLAQTVMFPICGWLLDRWGSRRIATASIALFGGSLLILSQIGNSLAQFYLAFVLIGLVSAGTNVISYARAISLWFDRKRGLALGIAASAQALGAFSIPIVMQALITQSGWPTAVLVLAAFEFLICLPLVALLVLDSPAPYGLLPDGGEARPERPVPQEPAVQLRMAAVVRTATFWKLAIGFALMGASLYAIITNVAYVLTQLGGRSLAEVALIQATAGVAVLVGRIGFGFMLDRMHAPVVAIIALALSAVCFLVYGTSASFAVLLAGGIIGGLAIGGESDLLPYLAGRYFGTGAVSKIFGWFLFAFFLGGAVAPVVFAWALAAYPGSGTPLYALAALQIVPALLFLSLGRYREASAPSVGGFEGKPVADAAGG